MRNLRRRAKVAGSGVSHASSYPAPDADSPSAGHGRANRNMHPVTPDNPARPPLARPPRADRQPNHHRADHAETVCGALLPVHLIPRTRKPQTPFAPPDPRRKTMRDYDQCRNATPV